MSKFLTKTFGFDNIKHNVRTEIVAGLTTFLTMAYILAVNPAIFSSLDMPRGAVFTATTISSLLATVLMAIYAKKPFSLAPGMGMNAFFVYTVCLTMGYSWQTALTAVFIEGILFVVMSATKIRSWILNSIPTSLKNAIGAGIGLFIAFIGLQNSGLIVNNDATLVGLGDITHGTALLAVIGLVITGVLVMYKIRGAMLIGILITTVIGLFIKNPATGEAITKFNGLFSAPASLAPIFCRFEWKHVLSLDMMAIVFTFLFNDMLNTMGTVIGVSQKAGFVDDKGNVDGMDRVFMVDALSTVFGACFGTSTITTYVESSAGIGEGGRTGLTAFVTACCFALALVLSPLFLAIPSSATAPALVIVGMMMMYPITKVNWLDYRESIPAFLTLLFMTCTYSISDGILIGCISYVVMYALTGKFSQISPTMWVLALLFILRYIFI